jgi:PAS domain S-box-containing protein
MATAGGGDQRAQRGEPRLSREEVDIVRRSSFPALLIQIPDEGIVAASAAAKELLAPGGQPVEGRSFEDFTADQPSGALDLILAGRLHGYETSRELRADGRAAMPSRIWVRSVGDEFPPRHVLAVISPYDSSVPTDLPIAAEDEPPPVIGTTDENLNIDRVGGDVETSLGYQPEDLLGRSMLALVTAEDRPLWLAATAQATMARAGVTMQVRAQHALGPWVWCEAFILAMSPAPACSFVLTPGPQGAGTQEHSQDVGQQLARLRRGIDTVNLSTLLAAMPRRSDADVPQLSARELDIVRRLLAGDRVPAIASSLFLGQSTVRNYLSRVYTKLGVSSQQELIDLLRQGESGQRTDQS